eukprot:1158818-Pelagomonas_calceolata.AAC.2
MKCAEEWLFEVNVLPPLVRELVYRSTGKPCATLSPGITGSPLSAQQMLHLCGPLKIVECECNTCDTLREVVLDGRAQSSMKGRCWTAVR